MLGAWPQAGKALDSTDGAWVAHGWEREEVWGHHYLLGCPLVLSVDGRSPWKEAPWGSSSLPSQKHWGAVTAAPFPLVPDALEVV